MSDQFSLNVIRKKVILARQVTEWRKFANSGTYVETKKRESFENKRGNTRPVVISR